MSQDQAPAPDPHGNPHAVPTSGTRSAASSALRTLRGPLITVIVGAVVMLGGGVLWILAQSMRASFGWFAYQPLAHTMYTPGTFAYPGLVQASFAVLALGAVVLAFGVGWAFGVSWVRSAPAPQPPRAPR